MAFLEKAAGQGHAYATEVLGSIYVVRNEYEQAVAWSDKGAEAGLPKAMHELGVCLDSGEGVAAPDHPAAADWYRHAAAGVRHPPVAESPTLPSRAPVVWWDSQGAWGKARIAKCYLLVYDGFFQLNCQPVRASSLFKLGFRAWSDSRPIWRMGF